MAPRSGSPAPPVEPVASPSLLDLDQGFLALPRGLIRSPFYRSLTGPQQHVVITMLERAQYKPGGFYFAGQWIPLAPGDFFETEETIAKLAKVSRKVVRTAIEKLEGGGELAHRKVHPSGQCPTVRTFVNYDRIRYAGGEPGQRTGQRNGQRRASDGPTEGPHQNKGDPGNPDDPEDQKEETTLTSTGSGPGGPDAGGARNLSASGPKAYEWSEYEHISKPVYDAIRAIGSLIGQPLVIPKDQWKREELNFTFAEEMKVQGHDEFVRMCVAFVEADTKGEKYDSETGRFFGSKKVYSAYYLVRCMDRIRNHMYSDDVT